MNNLYAMKFKITENKLANLNYISLILAILLNAVMAAYFIRKVEHQDSLIDMLDLDLIGIQISTEHVLLPLLGWLQLLVSLMMIFYWLFIRAPLLIKIHWREKNINKRFEL